MSLPEYQKLLSNDNHDDVEAQAFTYPPGAVAGPSSKRVIYRYEPLWPQPGGIRTSGDVETIKAYTVSGMLAPDEAAAKQLVYEYFPILADVPIHKISFKICTAGNQASEIRSDHWATVTNFTWTTFGTDPPEILGVLVEDTAEEARMRLRAVQRFFGLFFGLPLALIVALVTIATITLAGK